ncbi:MAG: hypothetical protein MJ192_08925 [Clostridia bacterium]|nr:hypothetical protein [Clostridia bacterium]
MKYPLRENRTPGAILLNMLISFVSLFVNGFGVWLTIRADFGAAPWDVFNLGLSGTFGIRYGTASIIVSCTILLIDILLREPIGLTMIIDAVTVGKTVDLFNLLDLIPVPETIAGKILMQLAGLVVLAYTYFFYMSAALGCGPRDTLLVGLKKRLKHIPIGIVSVMLLATVTLVGWLLGGPVNVGTLICAFGSGPIMQLAFFTVRFDATKVNHRNIVDSCRVLFGRRRDNR